MTRPMKRAWLVPLSLAVIAIAYESGCGARSELGLPDGASGASSSSNSPSVSHTASSSGIGGASASSSSDVVD